MNKDERANRFIGHVETKGKKKENGKGKENVARREEKDRMGRGIEKKEDIRKHGNLDG